ncbi:transglutaminase family protein [Roseomonas marmotae]|uniref:Transglutaminase family protein n=1 Tax=Roseomonas marmotae TaxID=2768161 RepID=A0ABS3KB73_9PROT|nr:transglutaminase family protein [Roseomonas marmotae]MBO1074716.1 transglutaminase family protein [Roseomonas marmotae]QTI77819.1 transglutaminase family protein [Roseomonas marmotae]
MSIHAAVTHHTRYQYDRPVSLGPQTIRLRPAPHARTPILAYTLTIDPHPHFLNWQQDPQGNFQARVVFPGPVTHFDITVDLVADMATINPFDFFLEPEAETWPFSYDPVLEHELAPFRRADPPGPLLSGLMEQVPKPPAEGGLGTVSMLLDINTLVNRSIPYVVRMEPGVWSPEETLEQGKGSCRDSAWLLVQLLRNLGFAARFVSGYLIQLVADEKPLEGPQGPGADFTDLHAWAEVYLPGAGWVGLDVTSGLLVGEGHIPLAATPEPQSAAPISGRMSEAGVEFDFGMSIQRVRQTPRVTKPYEDAAWQEILASGQAVDQQLETGAVRLTMGGEPTFVSARDQDAPEWNTAALGPTKRSLAGRLLKRLMPLWAPGGVVQYAMGRHYPGEQLPRWQLNAHWRADGQPVWRDAALLSDDDHTDTADAGDAADFAAALAARLGVDPALVNPAFEDSHYYLWKEKRLPATGPDEDARPGDPLERARLARIFAQGLGSSVGSVLPLRHGRDGWESGRWFFRDDALFLVPGDSPIGLRLPLDSLPWADPAAAHGALFPGGSLHAATGGGDGVLLRHQRMPEARGEAPDPIRTALTVEAREGKLTVFFPPLAEIGHWLELCAAVEDTAAQAGRRVVLEGYAPPRDPCVPGFSITPAPGVIEVLLHPATNWEQQVERTEQLYEAARQEGLAAQKFMLDGRHAGTGGGNHVVMGAARPADSPFLRRPDLLKSLLGFWHNHPSLSFLFAGQLIGPASQHPRIDEGRQDVLNELEIAFQQISPFEEKAPWVTDRLFRNILADMTGDTHRAEFSIDRLYPPDSGSGRLGLVEFRAFEMPPNPRMAAAQMLLMRAAVAAFWNRPYERRLVRWGTRLHDDFMLPHYAVQDLRDAIRELRELGAPLRVEWFEPHVEFRFPQVGEVTLEGIRLELRQALEPWHVPGGERTGTGAARSVDSSTERLQVKAQGFVPERFILAANGKALPMWATGNTGEFVAGLRFKARATPSALHPMIPVQAPLTFDLWDRWTGRSLGGFTHHVAQPGGRNYEHFPVNANEAEARRRARFLPFGHTPGPMPEPLRVESTELSRTLDLRRFA